MKAPKIFTFKPMKQIILFGAGKSATSLIDYLKKNAPSHLWQITIADSNLDMAERKVAGHPLARAVQIDILNERQRAELIGKADLVISMMPHQFHSLIAQDCLRLKKNLINASYVDPWINEHKREIEDAGLLFLCEMGLDPGIDHMSAMQELDKIKSQGGKLLSFKSHCGGLVAAESDNNPWHYKISWNPGNVVSAGCAGALYMENGKEVTIDYKDLYHKVVPINIEGQGPMVYYPNRDAFRYMDIYGLSEVPTFMRTTLRHPDFCKGWKYIVDWNLTGEDQQYDTSSMTPASFFREHFKRMGLTEKATQVITASDLFSSQMECLGLHDENAIIGLGVVNQSRIMRFLLESRLNLRGKEKDLIIMLHEFEYTLPEGSHRFINSLLVSTGEDSEHTAMAKSVGLPQAIAAKLVLEEKFINLKGVHIPTLKEIYAPILKELAILGLSFKVTEH